MAASPSDMTMMASSPLDSTKNGGIHSRVPVDEFPLLTKEEKVHTLHAGEATRRSVEGMEKTLKELETKYAAYVRHDTYGTMGTGDICIWEKAALVLALLVLVPIKVLLLFLIVFTYYLICKLCTMGGTPIHNGFEESNGDSSITPLNNESVKSDGCAASNIATSSSKHEENYVRLSGLRRVIIVRSGRFLSRAILFVLGFFWITVTRRDKECVRKEAEITDEVDLHPSAIVSNHVSYVDILYHMSASFPSFVAKRSVARLPLIGLISKCLGCVYVQREDKPSDFKGVAGNVCERLRTAANDKEAPMMLLFPEGTTTNGDYLLPFKTGAFVAGTPVQPVILKYPYRRFSPAWDTISGVRHVILLLCQFVNHLEAVWLPIYCPSEKEKSDPRLYANNVRKLMAAEGHLTQVEIGLQEKRIYHSFLNDYLASKVSE
ncbi:hypothetical protein L7F22_028676 [Adiantum nelumboides]|nr:hypothetical protein [Adiantum nelumboides]